MRPKVTALIAAVAMATGISATVLTGTAQNVEELEGLELTAYPDPAAPELATICYGETQGVHFGDVRTPEECEEMLIRRLPDYILPIKKLLPNLPERRQVAYAIAGWNLGVGVITKRSKGCVTADKKGACLKQAEIPGTSIADMELAGYWQGACSRLLSFTSAAGKHYNGLIHRRDREYRICMGEAA